MSRRRQFDEQPVVHAYWPHSDPEPAQVAVPANNIPADVAPGETPCPGSCNREFRAAEQAAQDETTRAAAAADVDPDSADAIPDPRIVGHDTPMHPGRPVWCVDITHVQNNHVIIDHRGCTQNILKDLRAIPDLAANLTPGTLNTPRDVRADDRGLGSSGMVHPPTNSPAWDTADELIRWALALEGHIRARLGHGPTSRKQWHTLNDAVRYLLEHPTALLADPRTAEAIGKSIRGRKRSLEQNTGHDRLIHRLPGTCMVCDRKGLQRADGGELVKCRHCRAVWAWESYERLSKAYADDVRRRGA